MTDDMIERMVDAGKAAVWDLILSGDAKGAKAVTKTTRACLVAALRAASENVGPFFFDGVATWRSLSGEEQALLRYGFRAGADRLEKADG